MDLGLIWLGSVISARKEKKKQAKTETAARAAAANTAQGMSVYPEESNRKPVKKSVVLAGVFFLLAALFGLWYSYNFSMRMSQYTLEWGPVVELAACFLLMIASFRTRHIQAASVLHAFGFLGLIASNAETALRYYRAYGFGGYTSASGIHYAMVFESLLKVAAFFLMAIFALIALRKAKKHLGGIVRVLWVIPALLLLLDYAKFINDGDIIYLCQVMFQKGWAGLQNIHPGLLEAIAQLMLILAVFLTGFCFQRICKKPAVNFQQAAANVPPTPVPPVQASPVQPQPESQPVGAELPKQAAQQETAQADSQDMEKKLQAYKDLLACGILTQEEYDQKVREMMHK